LILAAPHEVATSVAHNFQQPQVRKYPKMNEKIETKAGVGIDALIVVQALLDAENAHDVEAAVALFSDDAVVDLAVETRSGKAAIRAWQEELAQGHFHMRMRNAPQVDGSHVRFDNTLDLDMFKQMNLGTVDGVSEAIVNQGKIISYRFSLTPEFAAKLSRQ